MNEELTEGKKGKGYILNVVDVISTREVKQLELCFSNSLIIENEGSYDGDVVWKCDQTQSYMFDTLLVHCDFS